MDEFDSPSFTQFLDCIHCGLCLPACPTYDILGVEMDSPRGRVYLMRSLAEGKIELDESYEKHIDACLGCRACETACPSGVQFGNMMEAARTHREKVKPSPAKKILLSTLLHPAALQVVALFLRVLHGCGIFAVAKKIGGSVGFRASLAPPVPQARIRKSYDAEIIPALGERRARVGLLRGCVADVFFSPINRTTIRVLTYNGCEVVLPRGQTCCGALHAHNGFRDVTRDCARRNIDAFLEVNVDYIITNAAGCGATMKEYAQLLHTDSAYAERASRFVAKTRDISEYVASIEMRPFTQSITANIAYHDACHLAHGQNIRSAPRQLLGKIPGATISELNDGEMCCGSAGIYNIMQPEIASALQTKKMEVIRHTGARIVAAANPGCIMQIVSGAKRERMPIRVVHPVELLAESYGFKE